jgi:hypothetical protein
VYARLGKAASICGWGMGRYLEIPAGARKAGTPVAAAVGREQPRMTRGIIKGLNQTLDKSFRKEVMPQVLANKALAATVRRRLESLDAVYNEMMEWLDKPEHSGFDAKAEDCLARLRSVRTELRHELGTKEEPLPYRTELQRWGLID